MTHRGPCQPLPFCDSVTEISPQNGVARHHKAPSAFPNQHVPTQAGETTAHGLSQAVATASPCGNPHVPVPPRVPFRRQHAGCGARPAGWLRPPRSSPHLPKRPCRDGGTRKGWGRGARALGPAGMRGGRRRWPSSIPQTPVLPPSAAASSQHRLIHGVLGKTGSLRAPNGAPHAWQLCGARADVRFNSVSY